MPSNPVLNLTIPHDIRNWRGPQKMMQEVMTEVQTAWVDALAREPKATLRVIVEVISDEQARGPYG